MAECVQAEALHKHIVNLPEQLIVDLVVSSPLTRTLETATGIFANEDWTNESHGQPLMAEQEAVQVSNHKAALHMHTGKASPMQ